MIKYVYLIIKERKYVSVSYIYQIKSSREGDICLWSVEFDLIRKIRCRSLGLTSNAWVNDAIFMDNSNKLVLITDDRQYIYVIIQALYLRHSEYQATIGSNNRAI